MKIQLIIIITNSWHYIDLKNYFIEIQCNFISFSIYLLIKIINIINIINNNLNCAIIISFYNITSMITTY